MLLFEAINVYILDRFSTVLPLGGRPGRSTSTLSVFSIYIHMCIYKPKNGNSATSVFHPPHVVYRIPLANLKLNTSGEKINNVST